MDSLRFLYSHWRKSPKFSLLAILALAIGLGGCAAMFSLAHAVLLKPLPFAAPDRLVWIENGGPGSDGGLSSRTSQAFNFRAWQEQSSSFEAIGAYYAFFEYLQYTLLDKDESLRLRAMPVSQNFLEVLGVQPALGRGFTDAEMVWGNDLSAVILTDAFWRNRFDARPEIVGESVTLNNRPVTIIGVLPATFDFNTVFQPQGGINLLVPFPINEVTHREGNTLFAIGRLRESATLQRATAELSAINTRTTAAHPERGTFGAKLSTLDEHVRGAYRPAFWTLSAAVLALLLIVCLNLSNLMLVRAHGRNQETAIRMALGATPWQLARETVAEGIALAISGGILGLVLAAWALDASDQISSYRVPLLADVALSWPVVIGLGLVALLAGMVCGALPAWQIWRGQASSALNEAGARGSAGLASTHVRTTLLITQISLACALLIGSSLLVQSFLRLMHVDVGFDPNDAVAVRVDAYGQLQSLEAARGYYQALALAASQVPGVTAVGLSDTLPLGRNRTWGIAGDALNDDTWHIASPRLINGGYLQTMRVPLLSGRYLDARDTAQSAPSVVISESVANTLWPGRDPIGKALYMPRSDSAYGTVVGVVADVPRELEADVAMDFYLSMDQSAAWASIELVVRSARPTAELISDIRRAIAAYDPKLATGDFMTLEALIDQSLAARRLTTTLLSGFSSLALLVAALGIYSVVAFAVALRLREFAIRRALGSPRRTLLALVLKQSTQVALVGVAIGVVLALLGSGLLRSLLFGVEATDMATFAVNALVVAVVAVVASIGPALRASRHETVGLLR